MDHEEQAAEKETLDAEIEKLDREKDGFKGQGTVSEDSGSAIEMLADILIAGTTYQRPRNWA